MINKLVLILEQTPLIYKLLILPFYFSRFLYQSVRQHSWWFYRYPPGHYGSTIPGGKEIAANKEKIFPGQWLYEDGVDLNEDRQHELLYEFVKYFDEYDAPPKAIPTRRYYYDNKLFGFNDGFTLYAFMRCFQPARVVEIGSGFSSALMLDMKEDGLVQSRFTFIEPRPAVLNQRLNDLDKRSVTIIEEWIQNVDLDVFSSLNAGDLLFVDTSHVVKIGSDLSLIFFGILPRVKSGVMVHIHDVYWPFEYPKEMLDEGRNWNETYFVRSFLQFNSAFDILYFNSFVESKYRDEINQMMPHYFKCTGKSIWLIRK